MQVFAERTMCPMQQKKYLPESTPNLTLIVAYAHEIIWQILILIMSPPAVMSRTDIIITLVLAGAVIG